jgi:glycosyltransferase involved in cell wall biosynthesis
MRVLLVSSHGADRTYGGAERYVHDVSEVLRGRGDTVEFLSAFPVRDGSAGQTVTLHRTDWREDRVRRYRNHVDDWWAEPVAEVENFLRSFAPDLVHTNNLPGISTGIWKQAHELGIPVVHTLHDYHLLCPRTTLIRPDGAPCRPSPLLCGLRTRRLSRWAAGVSVVIGVSAHVLGRHQGFFGEAVQRRVIRAPLTALEGTTPPAIPAGKLRTIGYLGALAPAKGIELLLAAAPALSERGITLRVAGDGPLRHAVQAAPGVDYLGRLEGEALSAFRTGCDAGVIPSQWEEPGLTYVLFEWLASSRPVLATRRGGLAEAAGLGGVTVIEPTVEGLLAAVAGLQEETRWRALRDSIPAPGGGRDLDRWARQHLDAYDAALESR